MINKGKQMDAYQAFLTNKQKTVKPSGIDVPESEINPKLFLYQRDCVIWALKLGKAAFLLECGLGKTIMQLEWARLVAKHTQGKVLILAPLAVAYQTVEEGVKFGVTVKQVREPADIGDSPIVITNYERLHLFDAKQFTGVVLDESSILKSFMGKTKRAIMEAFKTTPYKLACTATPSPNDLTEIGNHAEFLNVKSQAEMQSTWFVNDANDTGTWRLKGHAASEFYKWLTSWAVFLSKPGDIGDKYNVEGFDLPELKVCERRLAAPKASIDRAWTDGRLIPDDAPSSTGMHKVKKESLAVRIEAAKEIVNGAAVDSKWVIWCDTNYEADALIKAFPDAIEVRGEHKPELKEQRLKQFTDGEKRMIITKPDIAGFGLNWQHCNNMLFVGVSYSFEKTYQALRRCWRFGQKQIVNAHMVYAETEGNIITILKQKQEAFRAMQIEINKAMAGNNLFRDAEKTPVTTGKHDKAMGDRWTLYLGDCVEQIKNVPDNSVGFTVYSPPFPDIFMYTDSYHDMGNVKDDAEFFEGYKFLVPEIFRITMPGRLCAVHCVDLPSFKYKHGHTGLRDFPGEIIRAHIEAGWIYHSRITIWKNPVVEMQRTKAHALLHKNFTAKTEQVRQGLPDYVLLFRKPESIDSSHVNQRREIGDYVGTEPPKPNEYNMGNGRAQNDQYSIAVWQRYASPVWFDIDQTNVLNYKVAKDTNDEKHICPLQLDVVARCVDLWTNKGDTVFSPFAGIGSEGYESLKLGRKFIGIELKESYWRQAQKFLTEAEVTANVPTLFDLLPPENATA